MPRAVIHQNVAGEPLQLLLAGVAATNLELHDLSSTYFTYGKLTSGVFTSINVTIQGTGFEYQTINGVTSPKAGTITGLIVSAPGDAIGSQGSVVAHQLLTLDGISLSSTQIQAAASSSSPANALRAILAPYAIDYFGSSGNDTFFGTKLADTADGGGGIDHITTQLGNDIIHAGAGNDFVVAGPTSGTGEDNDQVFGGDGKDTLAGGIGVDILKGENQDDVLLGGLGGDKLFGGAGIDAASYGASTTGVKVNLAAPAQNTGEAKGDVFNSIENLIGSNKGDVLIGNGGANVLYGSAGADTLMGGGGADKLLGGAGPDILKGGLGRDVFIFNSVAEIGKTAATRDVVTDFSQSLHEKITLTGIDAKSGTPGVNDPFTFTQAAAFTHHAGELHYKFDTIGGKAVTIVEGDVDGNGAADFQIQFTGHIVFTDGDFIL